jgi:hypothetical protein
MASVTKEIIIEAEPAAVWAAIGDFIDGPVRMAPGFVTGSRPDGPDTRVVTFADGSVLRECLVAVDDDALRLAYAVVGGSLRPEHDNASMQVFPHGDGGSRFVWIHDVLPDALAPGIGAAMDHGLAVFAGTFGGHPARER